MCSSLKKMLNHRFNARVNAQKWYHSSNLISLETHTSEKQNAKNKMTFIWIFHPSSFKKQIWFINKSCSYQIEAPFGLDLPLNSFQKCLSHTNSELNLQEVLLHHTSCDPWPVSGPLWANHSWGFIACNFPPYHKGRSKGTFSLNP